MDYFCGFQFSTSYSISIFYILLSWKFIVLLEGSNDITSLAWLTLYIALSSIVCPKSCILILICYFVNSMSNTVPLRKLSLKLIYFQSSFIYISGAPRKKYFKSIRCSESCLLILIWHYLIWLQIPCPKLVYKFKLLFEKK